MSRTLAATLTVLGFTVVVVAGLVAFDIREACQLRAADERRRRAEAQDRHPSRAALAGPFAFWESEFRSPYDHKKQGL